MLPNQYKCVKTILHNPPMHSFEVDVVKLAFGDVQKPTLVQGHRHHVARRAELWTNLEGKGKYTFISAMSTLLFYTY